MDQGTVVAVYETALRGSFFAGLLSLSGFLLAVHGFIVIKMKESVYDSEAYAEIVRRAQKRNPTVTRYGPLRRLSKLLFYSVAAALAAAVLQLTLGLLGTWWAAMACTLAALIAIALLALSMWAVRSNLEIWFDELEKGASEKRRRQASSGGT